MNKHIVYSIGIALSFVFGSCSSSDLAAPSDLQPDKGVISFTLGGSAGNGQALTRTETQTEDEQAITSLYVAAYKGNLLKAVTEADDAGSGSYTANVGASGSLDLYFIANPSEALITAMNALELSTTPNALMALTEASAPAIDGTATNFLMTAHETKTVSSTSEVSTDIGTIGLSRAAARIDITSVPTGFTLESVTFKNRYTQTLLGRVGDSDVSMDGLTHADQAYTAGIISGTTNTYTGYLYGYEDLAGTTQVVINGKYNGLAVSGITVDFATAGEGGTPLPLQRNRVYSIALTTNSSSTDLQNLVATLTVTDWDTSVTLAKSAADITNTSAAPTVAFSAFTNCAVNGTVDTQIDVTDNAAAQFTVTVTNNGSTLSKLVCTGLTVDTADPVTTGEGITITPGTVSYNADGTSTQVFTVAVEANAAAVQRVFTLKAENLLNRDAQAAFTVVQPAAGT